MNLARSMLNLWNPVALSAAPNFYPFLWTYIHRPTKLTSLAYEVNFVGL